MNQLQLLRQAFDRGDMLTVWSALHLHGVYALSQRAGDLIKQGYPLAKGWLTTNDGKRVRTYWRQ